MNVVVIVSRGGGYFHVSRIPETSKRPRAARGSAPRYAAGRAATRGIGAFNPDPTKRRQLREGGEAEAAGTAGEKVSGLAIILAADWRRCYPAFH